MIKSALTGIVLGLSAISITGCSAIDCNDGYQCGSFKPSVSQVINSFAEGSIPCEVAVVKPDVDPLVMSAPFEVLDIFTLPDRLFCNPERQSVLYTSDMEFYVFKSGAEMDAYFTLICDAGASQDFWLLSESVAMEKENYSGNLVEESEATGYAKALGEFDSASDFACN